MTLKVLAVATVLSAITLVQANATGFGRTGYRSQSWDSKDWWSSINSWLDNHKTQYQTRDWQWNCNWTWTWDHNRDCNPRPPCVPEPSSAWAGLLAAAGLGAIRLRRK